MERNGLLQDILFIDLLNEYPAMERICLAPRSVAGSTTAQTSGGPKRGDEHLQDAKHRPVTDAQRTFYRQFPTRLLRYFHTRRPAYDFAISLSPNWDGFQNERGVDMASMDAMDLHIWFGHHAPIAQYDMGKGRRR